MNFERAILISFLGGYVINNIATMLVMLIPGTPTGTGFKDPHYDMYVALAAIFCAVFAWWYSRGVKEFDMVSGGIFGVIGFVVSIISVFISGVSGVVLQSGSFAQVGAVLPNFWPFLMSMSTVVLALFWILPSLAVAYYLSNKKGSAPASAASAPVHHVSPAI
jgi:hypothetical protein